MFGSYIRPKIQVTRLGCESGNDTVTCDSLNEALDYIRRSGMDDCIGYSINEQFLDHDEIRHNAKMDLFNEVLK